MKVTGFDRLGQVSLLATTLFTIYMAVTQWRWGVGDPEWDDIASVPRTLGNYWALLGPFVVLLVWSLGRRWIFGEQDE